jgi:thioredoxin reductase (NADPH)
MTEGGNVIEETIDILILGGGVAGLTAGIYGARAKRSTLILDKKRPGGQTATYEKLENFPGFPNGVGGRELTGLMKEQAERFGCRIERGEAAACAESGAGFTVTLKDGKKIHARSLVLAPGCVPRKLGLPGEEEFVGGGVSYCATCDAELYEEAKIAVIGSGDAAVEEALFLSRFADEVVMIVVHDEGTLDCNKTLTEEAFANPKLTWMWNTVLTEIRGDDLVENLLVKNLKSGEEKSVDCEGVFLFVGTIPQTGILEGFVELDRGFIVTDPLMKTSRNLVFAAGDARTTGLRQVVTAAADGAVAAFYADRVLTELDEFEKALKGIGEEYLVYFYTPPVQRSLDLISEAERMAENLSLPLVKLDIFRFKNSAARFKVEDVPRLLHFQGPDEYTDLEI